MTIVVMSLLFCHQENKHDYQLSEPYDAVYMHNNIDGVYLINRDVITFYDREFKNKKCRPNHREPT